ncbi:MAG: TlpA family protein disulfide reductase [Saprospiraceae bacterium]|nr:TlpA family protein disulfide reductase [Saprospiraceae bacterium]
MLFKGLDDNLVSLKDFRGNLILLDFWFVGCRFCQKELPFTKKLIEEFKDKNFKVLQICMKSDQVVWEQLKNDFVGIPLHSNPDGTKNLRIRINSAGYPAMY